MDWKKVVASITNPKTGVIQKFVRSPTTGCDYKTVSAK